MAEEGIPTIPKATDSTDNATKAPEPTTKQPEPTQAAQGTHEPSNAGENIPGCDNNDTPADTLPEKTASTSLTPAKESKLGAPEGEGNNSDAAEGGETGAADEYAAANGTASSTRKSSISKRRSSGIPEHRSKKLNKKKSVARITHLDAQPGQYYFAHLRSYAPWPSIVCDEEMLPQSLLVTRPHSAKQKDGTYTEPFQDGGKKVNERTFPVMFLHTNEFAWIPNTDLTPLRPEECKEPPEKGKAKKLLAAYQVAAEGHDLAYFKEILADHQRALQQDAEIRSAAKAKPGRKKRKSVEVLDEPEDDDQEMMDVDIEKSKSTKKRKKDIESEIESDKPAKTPKKATKLKLSTPKAPGTGDTGKKDPASARSAKGKGVGAQGGKPTVAPVSDQDEPAGVEKTPEPKMNPAESKAKREKEVFYLRHRLQRGFLSRDQAPKEEEMSAMSGYLERLDSHKDLEISIIRNTKISKVLKGIIKLADIPKESEYNFRGRSIQILKRWKHWDASADRETERLSTEKAPKTTTNGLSTEADSKTVEAAPDTDEHMPDADAGESEKESEKESTPPAQVGKEAEKEAGPVAA
ncbi:hypothetical protein LOZ12_005788 [Ophidiomyces ophidiicola]|uniref:uncharacterized protein n=1 Tax=Ophidiomyces ophidiicola TaxID=1387563 RepID=UPI0020C5AF67|nr:uncharacterized protein LOZ57_003783 [Ophidiomyces ophidiicola]KAI1907211.1 hypothetical protein LOZ64_005951 [Ophidiomyces ophidiicola]KAI1935269.1 hypothetical protein LOZ62_006022 [Ophidiomyces ophidiicola]KAI1946528.1 hypothetical protein LOZ57_003783 [Ophidiomyces ophidiicola]KAI2032732.1 hypothetical protein LOZ47_005682 [Ophidiomyces ophidiicola]KAI2048928.1 hypothetical protein LOZ43_005265 [Ophidiomyces ophidiicola]